MTAKTARAHLGLFASSLVAAMMACMAALAEPGVDEPDRAAPPNVDQPLSLQADQLIYDARGNRVIAQGKVEVYYNNSILTADRIIYDQSANTLIAEGSVQLKDPNGAITRSERWEARDDLRDAFARALRPRLESERVR